MRSISKGVLAAHAAMINRAPPSVRRTKIVKPIGDCLIIIARRFRLKVFSVGIVRRWPSPPSGACDYSLRSQRELEALGSNTQPEHQPCRPLIAALFLAWLPGHESSKREPKSRNGIVSRKVYLDVDSSTFTVNSSTLA